MPPINSDATGSFSMTIHDDGMITFNEAWSGFTTPVLFSHIHFAPPRVAGGVMIFLCGGGGQPACPASGVIDNGTITAANVTGPTGQGITAGDLVSALRAIKQGEGYVNIHTTRIPSGEIRGQLRLGEGDQE